MAKKKKKATINPKGTTIASYLPLWMRQEMREDLIRDITNYSKQGLLITQYEYIHKTILQRTPILRKMPVMEHILEKELNAFIAKGLKDHRDHKTTTVDDMILKTTITYKYENENGVIESRTDVLLGTTYAQMVQGYEDELEKNNDTTAKSARGTENYLDRIMQAKANVLENQQWRENDDDKRQDTQPKERVY